MAVGLLVGAWTAICIAAGVGGVLYGAGLLLVPLAVTGGIHLDGFCDVVDAQASNAPSERKREILKDPHTGAFAAIGVAAYFVAYAAIGSEVPPCWQVAVLVGGMHVASRCLSGIATVVYPTSAGRGMLSMFHESGKGMLVPAVLAVEFVAAGAAMVWACAPVAAAMLLVGLACAVLLLPFANRQFGGMSGDLAGFFLQVAEIAMLATLMVAAKVVGLP
ncbi:MAG TPA: adenosylcobinamide-GDP ribazoletransferase [Eggerthellaceae bacterium]|nr:adenosylcobinamide-GDP ribazoletransferase [Eggerthellaceae bacterium]